MTSPYGPPGGNDPNQQWAQQPYGGGPTPGTPSGGLPEQNPGYGQPGQQQPYQDPSQAQQPYQDPAQQPYGGYGQQPQQPTQQYSGGYPAQDQQQAYGGYGQQQQFPGQQFPGQQQQFGQQPAKKKSGAWIWIVVVIVVLAAGAVGVTGFVTPGYFNKKVFDKASLDGDDGVKKILVDTYKLKVEKVDCPADKEVKKDTSFECTATIDGKDVKVKINVTSDDGEYQVSPPEE